MNEIIGKIQVLMPVKEFPENSGKYSIGIKVNNNFYNRYGTKEELEMLSSKLKKGYEVKLEVIGNVIEEIEVLSTEVEIEKEHKSKLDDMTNFEDLLENAHKKFKTIEIKTEVISIDLEKKYALFKATVIGNEQTFEAHGDATADNLDSNFIKPHFIRMAETRAIARALRWATNNAKVAIEETQE